MIYQRIFNQMNEFDTVRDAWNYAKNYINMCGQDVLSEDYQRTKEIMNLKMTVRRPGEGWPIPETGWNMNALRKYVDQFFRINLMGFDYTYGNRLRSYVSDINRYRKVDQIEAIIKKLKTYEMTRRAVAITWYPSDLTTKNHVPCLIMIDFLVRNNALNMTAVFRSHDIERAYPANMYALNKLLEYVGDSIGILTGSITTFSISAHVYI